MNCVEALELVARVGSGDPAVAAHLAVCADCRSRQDSVESLGRHLRDPLLWETPPEDLEDRVLEGVAADSQGGKRPTWWWVTGAAAAIALVVLVAVQVSGRPDWTVELIAGPAAPEASASVAGWNSGEGTRMVFEITGLEPAPADSYYEVWLTAPDGRHVSAGTFRAAGRVEVIAGVRRSDFPRIWVTREPADADPAPFRATVLDTSDQRG